MSYESPLIAEAAELHEEWQLDVLPEKLARDSLEYYYLSVYPGQLEAHKLEEDELPVLPEKVESAYVHTPFCSGVCDFCSYFLTTVGEDKSPMGQYLDTVQQEVLQRGQETDLDLSYIYFGGGTPSLIPNPDLERLFGFLDEHNVLSPTRYGTIELHPEFFADLENAQGFIDILKANGIGRVSLGFQSSDEQILAANNRRHDAMFLGDAIAFLKHNNLLINLDLMYGLPDMDLTQWERTLQDAVACQPDSISTYFLFVNPRTVTRTQVERGQISLPSQQTVQMQQLMAQKYLGQFGFHELPGDFWSVPAEDPATFVQGSLPSESVSLPLGAGSYGFYDRTQFFNEFSIPRYRQRITEGRSPIWRGHRFDDEGLARRDVMFSFKNSPYIDRQLFVDRYGADPINTYASQFELLDRYDLVKIDDSDMRVGLTAKGQLLVEEITSLFEDPRLSGVNQPTENAAEQRTVQKHNFAPTYARRNLAL